MIRCKWSEDSESLQNYHDNEWGKKVAGNNELFECLTLEIFQSGLSWRTILHKRENFRKAFQGFHIEKVRDYSEADIDRLMSDTGIVRHRKKIEATIENAKRVDELMKKYGSFEGFLDGLPEDIGEKQKALKQTFKHVGITTAESFLVAVGRMETSHSPECFLYSR
jgi:DNA-3-methyladenine glycosylase I